MSFSIISTFGCVADFLYTTTQRPKNASPKRFLNGLSNPLLIKNYGRYHFDISHNSGGEQGIRTLETVIAVYTISKTSPILQKLLLYIKVFCFIFYVLKGVFIFSPCRNCVFYTFASSSFCRQKPKNKLIGRIGERKQIMRQIYPCSPSYKLKIFSLFCLYASSLEYKLSSKMLTVSFCISILT